jgi:hypothetical protein
MTPGIRFFHPNQCKQVGTSQTWLFKGEGDLSEVGQNTPHSKIVAPQKVGQFYRTTIARWITHILTFHSHNFFLESAENFLLWDDLKMKIFFFFKTEKPPF